MPGAAATGHCPLHATHDKLNEAHYFIHQMADHYHEPDRFRYNLSAFLQSARNVTWVLQSELSKKTGFDQFWATQQDSMRADDDLKLLNDARVTVVHRSSLVPASSMFIGHFKYGKPRAGFASMPLHPMTDSAQALALGREVDDQFEHPHRAWCGEEFGLRRKWALEEALERELVQFALGALEKIADVFSEAHKWVGGGAFNTGRCDHFTSEEYRDLRESEVFPEVAKAWDGPPTEQVSPAKGGLSLLSAPSDSARVLHRISESKKAKGWVNSTPSKFWDREFCSMLLYSIGEDVITLKTGVFFKRSAASITEMPHDEDADQPLEGE